MNENDIVLRKHQRSKADEKLKLLSVKMRESLSVISKTNEGLNVLRFLLHESGFLAPLTFITREGVNKDVLLANESKRTLYLGLRAYMDIETITRIELDGIDERQKQEVNNV